MKYGGVSWNRHSLQKKGRRGMATRTRCKVCDREYKQLWTKEIHERRCVEREKANEQLEVKK